MMGAADVQTVLDGLSRRIHDELKDFMVADYWLVDAPYIRNVGDHLILAGERAFFAQFPACRCRGLHSLETFQFPEIREEETVFIHGGGNLGDVWPAHLDFQERIVAAYPRNRIVVLPQSAHFASEERLARTKEIWGGHGNLLTICARDEASYAFLTQHFPMNDVRLVPDMAFFVRDLPNPTPRQGSGHAALLFTRLDAERRETDLLVRYRQQVPCEVKDWPTIERESDEYLHLHELIASRKYQEADRYFRETFHPWVIRQGVDFMAAYGRIVTLRLHGLILALLLGKRDVRYVENSYGKIGSLCRTWLDGLPMVRALTPEDLPALDGRRPDLTVIVAAHRRPETLAGTLASIYRQQGLAYEVLVINGVEGIDSVDNVMREFPEAIYIKDARYLTLSAKHRHGIELARAPFVYMIDDDDCLTDVGFFAKAVDLLRADPTLAFVSGGVTFQIYEDGSTCPVAKRVPLAKEGRIAGVDFFRGCQILFSKPQSTCTTVFRVSSIVSGEALFECSDSSVFLKASLNGDAWFLPDIVADYRAWKSSMTYGRGSDMAFKLNVLEQKLALYREAEGKVPDALGWWAETFKMNFRYFERSIGSEEDREKLIRWGLSHTAGSLVIEAFCKGCRTASAAKSDAKSSSKPKDAGRLAELAASVRDLQRRNGALWKEKADLRAQMQESLKNRQDLWVRLQAAEKAKTALYTQLVDREAQRRRLEQVLARVSGIVQEGGVK